MFELRPFERRNNHVAAYDPWDQMERAFFGDGSWGRGLSEFKTDIQDKGDSYLLEAELDTPLSYDSSYALLSV